MKIEKGYHSQSDGRAVAVKFEAVEITLVRVSIERAVRGQQDSHAGAWDQPAILPTCLCTAKS